MTEEWRKNVGAYRDTPIEPADVLLERIRQEMSLRGAERRGKLTRSVIPSEARNLMVIASSRQEVGTRIPPLPPLPPLPEQHKIVEEIERRFSVADEVEKTVDQSLKQAERLRQSILKRAFEGKLVPQDPTDEPAEKLLERIKAKRAKLEYNKKDSEKTNERKPIKELINEGA